MNKNLDLIYQLSSISNSYFDRMGKMIKNYNEPDGTILGNFIEIVPLKVNEGLVEEPRPFTSQKNRQLPSKNYKIRARNKTKNVKKNTINNHHIENEDKNNNNNIDEKMNKLLNVTLEIKRSSTAESNRNNIYSNSTNRKYFSDLNTIEEVGNIDLHNLNKKPTFNKINEEQKNNNIISNNIYQNKIKTFYNNIKNEKDKLHRINTLQITNSFNKNKPNTTKTNLKDVSLMSSSNYNEFSPKNKTLYMNNNKILIFDNEISEKLQSLIRGNSVDNNTRNIKKEKEEKKLNTISNKNLKNKKEIPKEEITERIIRIRKNYQEKEKEMFNQNNLFYSILPGNASYLVKNCMCHRTNWKEPFSKVTTLFHFKWQEISYGIDYNNLSKVGFKQIVNHFENHYCISNKANLFCNLMKYCEDRKISVFKFVPFTVVYKFKEKKRDKEEDIKIFEKENQYAKDNLKKFINISNKFIVDYNDIGKYYEDENFIKESEKRQFEKEEKKEKKKKKKKKKKKEENENIDKEENENSNFYCDYFSKLKPNDRIIPTLSLNELTEKEKIERKKEKKKIIGSKTIIEIPKTHETGKNMWLVKAVNLNRGKCIKIVNSFEQIEKVIDKFKQGVGYGFTNQNIEDLEIKVIKENINNEDEDIKNNNNENIEKKNFEQEQKTYLCKKIIIQKYIENPLLYKERKCDIRIWVLLTHKMKVYVFKEGHLKTCSVNYDVNSKNAFSHITNYSFQKYNNNFQKFEKGNEVPFYEFQKFIDEKYPDKKYNLKTNLMEKVKEIIILTMRAGKEKINKNNRNYQFEIFGYDFMLDNDFNVFLIEINTNPGLEESSPWIKIIIPRMLDDALRLTLDQIYEPKYDFNLNYKNINDDINIQNVNDNLKNNIDPNSVINNNIKIFSSIKEEEENKSNIENTIDNENLNVNDKKIENKNQKYISPFPVPGYDLDENLWNFICDLNEKDPFDERLENEIIENDKKETVSFTGIKHLIKKKKNKQK